MIVRPDPAEIPTSPGSYQFRDAHGRVIYVGKAKSLRPRVMSYFARPSSLSAKTRLMLAAAESLTWITVSSEPEALLLEYNLIKEHRPRYNVLLRDDKSYPMIAVSVGEEWPRAMLVRGRKRPRNRYFGPYPNSGAARETLDLALRALPLRSCSPTKLARHTREKRPCLYYHIARCAGPCIGAVSHEEYRDMVAQMTRFLGGGGSSLVKELESSMREHAARLDFEVAARLRDQLRAVETVMERQEVVFGSGDDVDAFGGFGDQLELSVHVVRVRGGRVVGGEGLTVDRVEDLSDEACVARAVGLYYAGDPIDYPRRVIVRHATGESKYFSRVLSSLAARDVLVRTARAGRDQSLVSLAERNAKEEFARARLARAKDFEARSRGLVQLAQYLRLDEAPLRIECYDMSHLQGSNYVGSMVVMEDGIMRPRLYRHFMVSIPKNDDFGAMREVLLRRLTRLGDDRASQRFAYRPQLIVLDGGAGQLSVGVEVLAELGLTDEVPLASLAKSFEEVYRPGWHEPLRVPRSSEALFMLQQLRDEAHRFAITYHRQRRTLTREQSVLEKVAGLGPKRRAAVLETFGSIFELAQATPEEIAQVRGVSIGLAKTIASTLRDAYGEPVVSDES